MCGRYSIAVEKDVLEDGLAGTDFATIKRHYPQARHAVESYKIQSVEVTGELREIVDLFVRINSTGKPLTSGATYLRTRL